MKKNRKKVMLIAALVLAMMLSLNGCAEEQTVQEKVTEELNATIPELEENEQTKQEDTKDAEDPAEDSQSDKTEASDTAEKQEGAEKKPMDAAEETVKITLNDEELEVSLDAASIADETENTEIEAIKDDKLQIVFLGDSILDNCRDESGIAYLIGQACDANIYNLAMGGTTAALREYDTAYYDQWDIRNFTGVVHAICGDVDPKFMDGYQAKTVFDTCDFSKTDYFVIEYGVNDFLATIPINRNDDPGDQYSYAGAMRNGFRKLHERFPKAQIIFVMPYYSEIWAGDRLVGDSHMLNNGYGTLYDYACAGRNAADDIGVYTIDGHNDININAYTASEDLEDGIHPTASGREKYAAYVSHIINKFEGKEDFEWNWDNWKGWNDYYYTYHG